MRTYTLYSQLPQGFQYPRAFLELAQAQAEAPGNWLFVDAKGEVGTLLYSIAQSKSKTLVPFASLENGDGDVACFENSPNTNELKVVVLITDESERSYSFRNFSHWLEQAAHF
jgi:hypothetical protein